MRESISGLVLLAALAMTVMSCGSDHPSSGPYGNGYGNAYGNGQAYQQQYPQLAQYGQYQNYGGQQAWVPYQQPPQNWTPGQSYYQQGVPYSPPYYGYLNQPQCWQYNQGIGWNYQVR